MSQTDFGWLEGVMLAGVRIVAFLIIAPPFSDTAIPNQIRVMLGLGLALAVAPTVAAGRQPLDTGPFIETLVMQVLIGVLLGFLIQLAFAAVQSAGGLIDLFGGFQLSQAFDPQSLVNGAQFTRLFQMTAIALLVTTDGYQMVIAGVVRSFTAIPLGTAVNMSVTANTLITGTTQMFLASAQIAGPLVLVLFLADAGLGLLTRVAPALNAFSLGFPLKILITIMFSGVLFVLLPGIVSAVMDDGLQMVGAVN
ncbi:MAG: flagellar biosynthesis protein FliR [Glaciihabitans sp.]|jgi:flagellar biosynthetic protein FliR|nr:flagellar biosynthesis protein FliR [Glaciihabitans sp.]